jgi:hypothetical protein
MRILAVLAVALLSTAVLAGCSDDGGDEPSETTSSTSRSTTSAASSTTSRSSTTSSSSTGTTGPSNTPPSGSISAVAGSGSLPVRVNFTLTGSDPDGDVIVWDLAFGDGATDDGTTLPATVSHNYTTAGNFTAVFTITDGKESTDYDVAVAIAAGGAAGPSLMLVGTVSAWCAQCTLAFEAALTLPAPLPTLPLPSVSWASEMQGVDLIWVEVPAELAGHTFVATSSAADVGVGMLASCDPTAAAAVAYFDSESTPETGTVPAGTGCIVLWDFPPVPPGGPPADATLTLIVA